MTKAGTGSDESRSGASTALEDSPSPQLKQDKQELAAGLEEAARVRAEAARRIDDMIDKIDSLL